MGLSLAKVPSVWDMLHTVFAAPYYPRHFTNLKRIDEFKYMRHCQTRELSRSPELIKKRTLDLWLGMTLLKCKIISVSSSWTTQASGAHGELSEFIWRIGYCAMLKSNKAEVLILCNYTADVCSCKFKEVPRIHQVCRKITSSFSRDESVKSRGSKMGPLCVLV